MKTILITGANRGIGLELARIYSGKAERVIAVCRDSSAELEQLTGVRIESGIDVASAVGIGQLCQRLEGVKLDLLINNAGVLRRSALDQIEDQLQDFRLQYEVNALAPLRVTAALLGGLSEGSKVIIITSRMGSMADNSSGGHYGYRMSKAAVNAAGVSLANDLRPHGIVVGLLHPGYVRTGMTGHTGHVDAAEAAAGLVAQIENLTLDDSGSFVHASGERLPW